MPLGERLAIEFKAMTLLSAKDAWGRFGDQTLAGAIFIDSSKTVAPAQNAGLTYR